MHKNFDKPTYYVCATCIPTLWLNSNKHCHAHNNVFICVYVYIGIGKVTGVTVFCGPVGLIIQCAIGWDVSKNVPL